MMKERPPMYWVYYILTYLILPFALLRLCFKAKKDRRYLHNIKERLAYYGKTYPNTGNTKKRRVWLHAVSVGETHAAQPIMNLLLTLDDVEIILTHTTPNAKDAAQRLWGQHIGTQAHHKIKQMYLPYDTPWCVRRFFMQWQPTLGIIMETEFWPNLLHYAKVYGCQMLLANARMSAKSAKRMQKYASSLFSLYHNYDVIMAQSHMDAKRFAYFLKSSQKEKHSVDLGIYGNLKFDAPVNQIQKTAAEAYKATHLPPNMKVILLASTRDGEEAMIFEYIASLPKATQQQLLTNTLWCVVPRHMHRLPEIEALLQKNGYNSIRKTAWLNQVAPNIVANNVVVGDTMGEMAWYFALSDIVIMGGSWQVFGGQNFLEAAQQGKAIICGPHMYNFAQVSKDALKWGALIQTPLEGLAEYILNLLHDPSKLAMQMQKSHAFAEKFTNIQQHYREKIFYLLNVKH